MQLAQLAKTYSRSQAVRTLLESVNEERKKVGELVKPKVIPVYGLHCSSAPLVMSCLANTSNAATILIILNDAEEAGYFYHDMVQVLSQEQVLFFPSPYRNAHSASATLRRTDSANEILRTEVLANLARNTKSTKDPQPSPISPISPINQQPATFIITHPEALMEKVPSGKKINENTLLLHVGENVDTGFIAETLRTFGFTQQDYVYEPGQFALRGSIIDVYSYNCEYPYRIDFFGDDVDSIRTFDVQTQLSVDRREEIEIVSDIETSHEEQNTNDEGSAGSLTEEEEDDKVPFLDALPPDTIIVTKNLPFVCDIVDDDYFTKHILDFRRIELRTKTNNPQPTTHNQQPTTHNQQPTTHNQQPAVFSISPQPLFHKNFDLLTEALEDYIAKGYRIYILADSSKQQQRLKDIFDEKSQHISFTPVDRTIHEGFIDDDEKMCFLTDHQIFDRYHKYSLRSDKARSGKIALTLKELQQFTPGDLIVHVDHGIGRFDGLVRLPQGNTYQEMIKISYQGNDTIYVSIHSLHKVSKYRGKDGAGEVKLSRLGTGAWENLKERTKKKIKDIARDLIVLYARRRKEKGFAFSADSFMQHELEASFLYEDTPDQLKATNDVKADMEKPQPMDRLICGDVGFGKTEVAVRAAFKAACDSKQVAVLVPTTVLAYQHYQTFSARLKGMPVKVDYLSRARSAKKVTAILSDLAEGKIDIIIGTHKLLSKTVHFKDLGLLIIDEEQKFGVTAKEKLRQIRANVDTITMSATPIPRTLQFSLMGARDLSVIQTPPPNRYPIQTEVQAFDSKLIAEAIRFEMSRNGQVFLVSNRINSLDELRIMIERSVPEARVAIGHGQMKPEELEQIVMGFINYDYDVLLSTTIVENGIDIPNANTIIINNAQNFGLSDLHQMRGRVGRGNRKAFCYLLAPPLSALPADSRKRLEAIETFSDLGSGIHLAMQDLDIRGAGNLLGAEQSGFIADLGYEVYQKILNEAITEIRNEEPRKKDEGSTDSLANNQQPAPQNQQPTTQNQQPTAHDGSYYVADCSLETDLEMCFPDSYVPSSSERMLLYRELDNLKDDEEVERFRMRLIDRFGKVPKEGEELLKVVKLRREGKQMGVERIVMKQGRMNLYLVSNADSPYYQSETFGKILHYITMHPKECALKEVKGKRLLALSNIQTIDEAIRMLEL